MDPSNGEITLFCTDEIGSCLRQRCECDRDLANKLASHEHQWNMNNHHKWGNPPFNPQQTCGFNVNQFITGDPEQQQTLTANVVNHLQPELIQQQILEGRVV